MADSSRIFACRRHTGVVTVCVVHQTYRADTEIGTLAVNGWPVTFGTARMGLGGGAARPVPSSLYPM